MTTIKPAVDLAARGAVAARTEELFRASGALREGHFQLKSGRHADAYVEKFAVLSDPAATSELCGFWAARMRGGGDAPGPFADLVAGREPFIDIAPFAVDRFEHGPRVPDGATI